MVTSRSDGSASGGVLGFQRPPLASDGTPLESRPICKVAGARIRNPSGTGVGGFVRTQALLVRLELSSRSRSARSAWERRRAAAAVKGTERTIVEMRDLPVLTQAWT